MTAYAAERVLVPVLPDGHLAAEILRLVLTIGAATAVLAMAAHALRIREFQMALAALARRTRGGST